MNLDFKNLSIPRCKKFSGYKPCYSYKNCLENGCQDDTPENRIGKKILIISLDALGNVLDNTPILYAIKNKSPESTVYWLTMPAAENILRNNPLIDRLYLWTDEHRMILRNIKFDILMNADKSQYACAFANEVNAKTKLGFLLNEDGVIVPANESAMYSYILGNNDQLKFRENTRTGIDILHEVFELANKGDDYIFTFSKAESDFIGHYKEKIGYDTKKIYVGFNTGCSELFPNKKMTIDQHIWLIKNMLPDARLMIVLLGGREDTDRNNMIYHAFTKEERARIINTPTDQGIRKGACYMAIPDIVITGDSFGLHLAIALRRWIIVWFGLSCAAEIELYGRGEKLMPKDLECSPCWKRECPNNLECIQQIDLDRILELVKNYKKQ